MGDGKVRGADIHLVTKEVGFSAELTIRKLNIGRLSLYCC